MPLLLLIGFCIGTAGVTDYCGANIFAAASPGYFRSSRQTPSLPEWHQPKSRSIVIDESAVVTAFTNNDDSSDGGRRHERKCRGPSPILQKAPLACGRLPVSQS